jgi:diguanylate cyclase (GGDEF)-like protein
MASRLKADYLSNCFAARLGGDEFVLLISDQAMLKDLAGLLRRLLYDLQYSVSANGATLHVSATIGACWLGGQVTDRGQLLRNADAALYEAKRMQRGSAKIAGKFGIVLPSQAASAPLALVQRHDTAADALIIESLP